MEKITSLFGFVASLVIVVFLVYKHNIEALIGWGVIVFYTGMETLGAFGVLKRV